MAPVLPAFTNDALDVVFLDHGSSMRAQAWWLGAALARRFHGPIGLHLRTPVGAWRGLWVEIDGRALGRLTSRGDVERWGQGGSVRLALGGIPPAEQLTSAIAHLQLNQRVSGGDSSPAWLLVLELCAQLALRRPDAIVIRVRPEGFRLHGPRRSVEIDAYGTVNQGRGSLWERWLAGADQAGLLGWLAWELGVR